MTAFRKFMVHNYFGERWMKIPFSNRYASSVRQGALNMFTILVLVGIPVLLNVNPLVTGTVGIIVFAWILWTGFPLPNNIHYFGLFPPTWKEMLPIQRWAYGRYALSKNSPKDLHLTREQAEEYFLLSRYYKQKFNLKR